MKSLSGRHRNRERIQCRFRSPGALASRQVFRDKGAGGSETDFPLCPSHQADPTCCCHSCRLTVAPAARRTCSRSALASSKSSCILRLLLRTLPSVSPLALQDFPHHIRYPTDVEVTNQSSGPVCWRQDTPEQSSPVFPVALAKICFPLHIH